jgi:adenylate cyclase
VAELFVVNGICGGTVFFLPDVPTVLGRSPECHVQVADPWISSMHALFERRGDQLWIVDLDSRNGTFVDEQRVHEAAIQPGARLRFGKTAAELRAQADAAPPPGILSDQRTIIRYLADVSAEGGMAPLPPAGPPAASTSIAEAVVPAADARRDTLRGASGANGIARRHIGVVNEIGRAQLGVATLEDAMRHLLRVLAAAVRAERSSVLLMDERGELTPIASEPADGPPRRSTTLIEAALRSRAGILTLDAQQDFRFAQSHSIISQGIRSCICAPIWADNRILGVLLLERGLTDPFDADDLELATLVGFQAALSVERLRMAERARAGDELRGQLLRHLDEAAAAPLLGAEAGERDPLEPAVFGVGAVAVALDGVDALAAHRPGPEAARRLLALQGALVLAARAEGAAVEARLGGGLLAIFGLVNAQGDAAARAARCAEALLARARELEAACEPPRLAVRLGVATGRALVGNFGTSEHPELRAAGDVVETAERRAAEASPGAIRAGGAS